MNTPANLRIHTLLLGILVCPLGACIDAERTDRAAEDESSGGDTDPALLEIDEAPIIEMARAYADNLTQLSAGPEFEETHADAAAVVVWGSGAATDLFFSIDPTDPTQDISFPAGSMFVKQQLDAAGATIGLTIMYKAEAGYNPDARDWFWARTEGDLVTDAGRVAWCSNCHSAAYNSDFVVGFGKSP